MKPIWQSKTFWANLALRLGGYLASNTGWLAGVPAEAQIIIVGVINLVLRLVTKTGVTLT